MKIFFLILHLEDISSYDELSVNILMRVGLVALQKMNNLSTDIRLIYDFTHKCEITYKQDFQRCFFFLKE